jgi:hypothetical protein
MEEASIRMDEAGMPAPGAKMITDDNIEKFPGGHPDGANGNEGWQ